MNKTHLFFCEERKLVQGLTLVEVIVGMLISALCLSTALQAYVAAVGVGAKAQDSNVAIKVIQSDLEGIRQKAQEQEQSDCSLQTSQISGYAQKLMAKVLEKDPATFSDSSTPWTPLSNPASLPSEYQIARTMSVDNSASANTTNVLQIAYKVTHSGLEMTKLNTAVMPDVAMVCP